MRIRLAKGQGFSLIELMVSLVIASLLMLSIVQVLYGTKQTYIVDREIGFLQENARFAMEILRRELVRTGSLCGPNANVANVVVDSGDPAKPHLGMPGIEGWDDSQTSTDFPDDYESERWSGTDSVYVRGGEGPVYENDLTSVIDPILGGAIALKLPGAVDADDVFAEGDMILITDSNCNQISVVKSGPLIGDNMTIRPPGVDNCAVGYGPGVGAGSVASWNCSSVGVLSSVFPFLEGSRTQKFTSSGLYIAPSALDSSVPALWRSYLSNSAGTLSTVEQEMVQGVENMQLKYGYDTDTPQDGVPDYYLPANDSTIGTWDWDRVTSVRVALLMRSITITDPENYDHSNLSYEGLTIANDKYSRQVVYSVIQLKNRVGY